jgi:hypothetical protein
MATAWTVQRDNRLEKIPLRPENPIKADGGKRTIADFGLNRK